MRIAAVALVTIGILLLAEALLSGLLRPLVDPGMAPSVGAPVSQWVGPGAMVVGGLLLFRKAGPPKAK